MATKTQPESLMLTARQAAALLGVGLATVWRRDAAALMPKAVRHGRVTRWRKADLLAWLDAGCPDRRTWEATKARR